MWFVNILLSSQLLDESNCLMSTWESHSTQPWSQQQCTIYINSSTLTVYKDQLIHQDYGRSPHSHFVHADSHLIVSAAVVCVSTSGIDAVLSLSSEKVLSLFCLPAARESKVHLRACAALLQPIERMNSVGNTAEQVKENSWIRPFIWIHTKIQRVLFSGNPSRSFCEILNNKQKKGQTYLKHEHLNPYQCDKG